MDNFGGVNPNPVDPNFGATPQQPVYADPNIVAPQQQGFASVPMTDPNAPGPMVPPVQPAQPIIPQAPTPFTPGPMDTMLDQQTIPATSSGGGKGKTILLIIIVIVLVGGSGAGGYFAGYASGKTAGKIASDAQYQADQAKQPASSDSGSSTKSTPEKLDLSAQVDPDYSKDETLTGTVGDTETAADGFVLKVNNIERNFTTDDPAYKADPTKELVKVNFQMGNITKAKTMDINNVPFRLIDSTGAEVVPETIASYDGKFDTTKLDPGTQSTASLIFAVTKDETPLKFSRKQPYRISNQNREVTFQIVITLTK